MSRQEKTITAAWDAFCAALDALQDEAGEPIVFVLGPYRNDDPRVLDMVANGATFDRVDAPVTTQAIYNFAPKVTP